MNDLTFYDRVQIGTHIDRILNDIFGDDIENYKILKIRVCDDIENQIKREYGLEYDVYTLDNKYLADLHDFLDCYTLPRVLEDEIEKARESVILLKGLITN